eukprot:jgi/Chrpa1/22913/Chrysochromulina_OHIO_Genome00023885-RA
MGWFGPSKAEKLYKAAEDGYEAELTRLIGRGANVNWHNPKDLGLTALHWATYGHPAIAKRLLEGGADPTLRTRDGKTAIDWARERGKSEVVALLSEPRRRLGRTRTTVYLPLGERMAASCHGMRPRARNGRPLGRHSASPLHALHIWRRVQNDRIPGAVLGISGVSGRLAAWFASLVAAETGRAGRATDSGTTTRAQARTWTLSGALTSTLAQSSAISSTQAAITSNQDHSVAPRRRPTPSWSKPAAAKAVALYHALPSKILNETSPRGSAEMEDFSARKTSASAKSKPAAAKIAALNDMVEQARRASKLKLIPWNELKMTEKLGEGTFG